jgi:outer membrane protein OmpA-like peptidoglycan-associated protein
MNRSVIALLLLAGASAPAIFGQAQPLYSVTVERTIKSIGYRPNGSTKVDFKGTVLAPVAKGEAEVKTNKGAVQVAAKFDKVPPASSFGPEYLTYVLWAISPEGRARNLGEVFLKGDEAKVDAASPLQAFGMMVTAEPYFSVSVPSDVVVLENDVRRDTVGNIGAVDAKLELLSRGNYKDAGLQPAALNSKIPLDLYQARNAVQVAKSQGADHYATDTFNKAMTSLQNAEGFQSQKKDMRKQVIQASREAAQTAEDARVIAVRRAAEEKVANEKAAADAREAAAKAAAEREAQAKRDAQAAAAREAQQKREAELAAQREAEAKKVAELQAALAKAEAERQAEQRKSAEAAAAKAESDRLRAQLEEQQAKAEADQARQAELAATKAREDAEAARLKAERDQQELRANLLRQFNLILETRDTARGLVVNLGDVLFDTGKFDLRPPAKEALAKLSGIVLSHPGLKLDVEGHTDSVGSDDFNQKLSEQRAGAVRAYLIAQKLEPDSVVSRGFGKSRPVASNDTAQGRQQNRRVEIIVSGEVIGVKIN